MTTLFKGQENIAAHGNGDMGNYAIIITQLSFPFQVEVMLHHLEEHLNIPTLAVDPYDVLVGQTGISGDDCKPLPLLVTVTNEHNFHILALFGLHYCAGKDLGFTRPFPQKAATWGRG